MAPRNPNLFAGNDPLSQLRLRTLDGSGPRGSQSLAALRVMDFDALVGIDLTQQSAPISGPPTMDDYNRLVDDLSRVFQILNGAKLAIQARGNGGLP